jgi:hypothetical protein
MKKGWIGIVLVGLLLLLVGCIAPNSLSQIQGGETGPGPSAETPDGGLPETPQSPAQPQTPTQEDTEAPLPLIEGETSPDIPPPEFDGLTPSAETSLIFQALNDAGIKDAAVDFQSDKVLVAFDLPAGMTIESSAYFTFGVVSKFAQPSQIIWVQVFSGSTSKTYSVKADTVQKYTAGKLNENQLKLAVTVQ